MKSLSRKELARVLERHGWRLLRTQGSHYIYGKEGSIVRLSVFDKATTAIEHEISLLREYHSRLISNVVSGKLDVRVASSHLPDEAEEPTIMEADNGDVELEPELDEIAEETEA
jgi:predicted RNA binding protein YcfA (HicA-like mRNA interferase family)